ncbi:MAG: DUF2851 family protein [Cytophagales bacterium]|nr:DUF2851 family protein [Bernardetiaceae bacterium]MDW8204003.1 DUF2851 family protein [Cytophagales bacterium]
MNEDFLSYLWQFQYFDKRNLQTESGEPLSIIKPGTRNPNAGADFTDAALQIGTLQWFGQIEVHVRTTDWLRHRHQLNAAYDGVILHVVWENDALEEPLRRSDGSIIPVLALKQRTHPLMWERYALMLAQPPQEIACASQLYNVPPLTIISTADRMLVRRLHRKSAEVLEWLQRYNGDWQQVAYMLLMRNMGFKINTEPMLALSLSLPYAVLRKNLHEPLLAEALLLGVAGWLADDYSDAYLQQLQAEFRYLAHKYNLTNKQMPKQVWKTAKMRPANFPVRRLAQVAAILCHLPNLFTVLIETTSIQPLVDAVSVPPSDYWQHHYLPEKPSERRLGGLGRESALTLLINTVFPLLAAYAQREGGEDCMERAVQLMAQLPPEDNAVTRRWQPLPLRLQTAADTQAAIELYNEFCCPRRCLQCGIGTYLVRGGVK